MSFQSCISNALSSPATRWKPAFTDKVRRKQAFCQSLSLEQERRRKSESFYLSSGYNAVLMLLLILVIKAAWGGRSSRRMPLPLADGRRRSSRQSWRSRKSHTGLSFRMGRLGSSTGPKWAEESVPNTTRMQTHGFRIRSKKKNMEFPGIPFLVLEMCRPCAFWVVSASSSDSHRLPWYAPLVITNAGAPWIRGASVYKKLTPLSYHRGGDGQLSLQACSREVLHGGSGSRWGGSPVTSVAGPPSAGGLTVKSDCKWLIVAASWSVYGCSYSQAPSEQADLPKRCCCPPGNFLINPSCCSTSKAHFVTDLECQIYRKNKAGPAGVTRASLQSKCPKVCAQSQLDNTDVIWKYNKSYQLYWFRHPVLPLK